MQTIYPTDKRGIGACVATVGFFDGVHAGHRFLIGELKSIAQSQGLKSAVVTFAVHPRKVLNSDFQPQLLNTHEEKTGQLATTGIDACIVLDFSKEMARLSAYEFIKLLMEKYKVQVLLVGHDHRFGHNRAEGFEEYRKYGLSLGMEVIQAQRFSTETMRHISSSEIRQALQQGDIGLANSLLTYAYSLEGIVVDGFKVGRKIGFPTANIALQDPQKLIPGTGVYAVMVTYRGNQFKGMLNIGTRPTLDNGNTLSIEVHIIGFEDNIYNEVIRISFLRKIRDEKKFDGMEMLIEQLKKDKAEVLREDNGIEPETGDHE